VPLLRQILGPKVIRPRTVLWEVTAVLAEAASTDGSGIRLSYAAVAAELDCGEKQVGRAVTWLIESKLVFRAHSAHGPGRGKSGAEGRPAVYELTMTPEQQLDAEAAGWVFERRSEDGRKWMHAVKRPRPQRETPDPKMSGLSRESEDETTDSKMSGLSRAEDETRDTQMSGLSRERPDIPRERPDFQKSPYQVSTTKEGLHHRKDSPRVTARGAGSTAAEKSAATTTTEGTTDMKTIQATLDGADGPLDPDEAFGQFWAAYPRKVAKRAARAAWDRAVRRAAPEVITAGAEAYRDDLHRKSRPPEYTAHPATWLNGDRWADEPTPVAQSPNGQHRPYRPPADDSVYDRRPTRG
jgi:hypothetical protein